MLGTSNINLLYSAISFMSVGNEVRPVIPLGKNTLTYILKDPNRYGWIKQKVEEEGIAIVPREEIDEDELLEYVPSNAILVIKEEDEAGGHGQNMFTALELYALKQGDEPGGESLGEFC